MVRLDRSIRIFRLDYTKDEKGRKVTVKTYLNKSPDASDRFLCSFRDLSAKERFQYSEMSEDTESVFEINRRKVTVEDFIEYESPGFGLLTYRITGIDSFSDYSKVRMRIRAKEVPAPKFALISYGGEEK